MNSPFSGIWPAMITPYDDSGNPSLEQLDRLVESFIQQRLGGAYILGSSGQGLLLSLEERKTIAARVVQTAAGRIPIMVHVGALKTDDSVELARHASQIGADAVASLAPVYYRLDADQIFEHYRRIGAASELPFFVYQIDLVNQPQLPMQEYITRVLELPNIAGIKVTSGDLYQLGLLCSYSRGRLKLFSGIDQVLCHGFLSGASGAIGFFFNLWGNECRAAYKAMISGRVDAARRFMLTFQQAAYEFHALGTWPHLRQAMLNRFDIDIGRPRAPVATVVKPVDHQRLDEILQRMEQAAIELETTVPAPHHVPMKIA